MKVRNLKPLSIFVFVFALAREKIFIKTHNIESRFCHTTGEYTVCRHMRAFFSPENVTRWDSEGVKIKIKIKIKIGV